MSLKIVVARYNESLDWTTGMPNCIIYNKGPDVETQQPMIKLPNVGREGHTYLHHIIENYDTLDDYTMFLQGFPFDHTPFLELILERGEWKRPFHIMARDVRYANINRDETCDQLENISSMIPTFNAVFNRNKIDHPFYFGAGAQFCVSRDTIRTRPKHFYEKIRDILSSSVNPIEGYWIERFWPMIFLGEALEDRAY